jgi:hypothetical protein
LGCDGGTKESKKIDERSIVSRKYGARRIAMRI